MSRAGGVSPQSHLEVGPVLGLMAFIGETGGLCSLSTPPTVETQEKTAA